VETLVALLVVGAIWLAIAYGAKAIRAAGRAALGKGTLADNLEVAFKGMGPLDVRLTEEPISNEPGAPKIRAIEVKGLAPVHRRRRVAFATSVLDATSEALEPVPSLLDAFQEPNTRAYQHLTEVGYMEPGMGLVGWVRVGVVLPQILEPPFGGTRKFAVVLRLIDLDSPPNITGGFAPDHDGLIWLQRRDFAYAYEGKGYRELELQRDEARNICIQMGVFIAMIDRQLSTAEGEVLKGWIQKVLTTASGDRRELLRSKLNKSMKEGYASAKNGKLSLPALTYRLKEIDDKASKYEAIELCYDVLGANDKSDSEAARIIDLTARVLELDLSELERIRDLRLVGSAKLEAGHDIEDLIGIDRAWDRERKKKHLRAEFQKWNNRITTLPEGPERENAQKMLDAVSEARRKYG
jgi:hypothetical protein